MTVGWCGLVWELKLVISVLTYYCLLTGANWYVSPSPGNIYVGTADDRIGSRYIKALYRECTDETCEVLKPPKNDGMMGKISCSKCCFYHKISDNR